VYGTVKNTHNSKAEIRNNNFNIIRLCATAFVMAGHAYILNGTIAPSVCKHSIHAMGVYFFFLLGGYFISQSWMNDARPIRYALKRIFRIWPPFAAVVLFSVFIIGPVFTSVPIKAYFENCFGYLKNLRMYIVYTLPGVFENNPISTAVNGSIWILPIEIGMYIIIPVFYSILFKLKLQNKIIGIIVSLVAVASCVIDIYLSYKPELFYVIYGTDLVSAAHVLPFYCIGMAISFFDIKRITDLPLAVIITILFISLDVSYIKTRIMLFAVLPYLIFSLGFAETRILTFFRKVPELSYGIFLFGFIVQQSILNVLVKTGATLSSPKLYVISFVVSVGLAYIMYLTVERPTQKLLNKILSKIN